MTAHWVTVTRKDGWFVARCSCGWTSNGRSRIGNAEKDADEHGVKTGHMLEVAAS